MHLGMGEMLIVVAVALLVFGPQKLPQLGDALGKGLRSFKDAARDADESAAASGLIAEPVRVLPPEQDPRLQGRER